jgi:hypothetical protein
VLVPDDVVWPCEVPLERLMPSVAPFERESPAEWVRLWLNPVD